MSQFLDPARLLNEWSALFRQDYRKKHGGTALSGETLTQLHGIFGAAHERLRLDGKLSLNDPKAVQDWLDRNKAGLEMGEALSATFRSACSRQDGAVAAPATVSVSAGPAPAPAPKAKSATGRKTKIDDAAVRQFAETWHKKAQAEFAEKRGQSLLSAAVIRELGQACRDACGNISQRANLEVADFPRFRNSFSAAIMGSPHHTILMQAFDKSFEAAPAPRTRTRKAPTLALENG